MIDVINDFIVFLGLDAVPTTFPEMFKWLVMVMVCCSMLSGIIRTLFSITSIGWRWRR